MSVRRNSLGALKRLGDGNFAIVYEVQGRALAYKEFKPNQSAKLAKEVVRRAEASVAFWKRLDPSERADLAEITVWPTEVVVSSGVTVGVLMPLIPPDFFHVRTNERGGPDTKPNEIQWLFAGPSKLGRRFDRGLLSDPVIRQILVAKAIYAFAWLHAKGVVFGDVNAKNMVFALNPPRVILLDCDGTAVPGTSREAAGRNALFWFPPELEAKPGRHPTQDVVDEATDVWKVGALVLRALTPGKGASQRRQADVARLRGPYSSELADLLSRALASDRKTRPTMSEFYADVFSIVATLVAPPVATQLWLDTEINVRGKTIRGESITINWSLIGATSVRVQVPGIGDWVEVDLGSHAKSVTVAPRASGELVVELSNRFGSTMYVLGPIRIFEMPTVDYGLSRLPALKGISNLPGLSDTAWNRLRSAAVPHPEVPALPLPELGSSFPSDRRSSLPLPPSELFDASPRLEVLQLPEGLFASSFDALSASLAERMTDLRVRAASADRASEKAQGFGGG